METSTSICEIKMNLQHKGRECHKKASLTLNHEMCPERLLGWNGYSRKTYIVFLLSNKTIMQITDLLFKTGYLYRP
jgi:hypothetical protein